MGSKEWQLTNTTSLQLTNKAERGDTEGKGLSWMALLTVFLLSIMHTQIFFHYSFTLMGRSSNYFMNFQNFFIA